MNILHLITPTIQLPSVTQQTDSHCGPAVIQLLLAFVGREFTQDEIVTAARARARLMRYGTRPDHLARAVAVLAPDMQFWFKENASIEDLNTLIKKHHWPVGVNWQGLFYDTLEEEQEKNPDDDHGHYSVAININPANDKITIADPYSEYAGKPRVFSLQWFVERWWDTEFLEKKYAHHQKPYKFRRLIFLVAPKDATFPQELGMELPDKLPSKHPVKHAATKSATTKHK